MNPDPDVGNFAHPIVEVISPERHLLKRFANQPYLFKNLSCRQNRSGVVVQVHGNHLDLLLRVISSVMTVVLAKKVEIHLLRNLSVFFCAISNHQGVEKDCRSVSCALESLLAARHEIARRAFL